MGYAIYISYPWDEQGEQNPIDFDKWCTTIKSIKGLRLATGDIVGRNPQTGEVLRMANRVGDVEMYDPSTGEWNRKFFWQDGRAIFSPPDDFDRPENTTRGMALKIAQTLGAEVRGEGNELYS